MQMKNTVRYHIPVRMAIMKKQNKTKQKITNVGKDMKLEPFCTTGGNVKWYSCYEEQHGNSSKNYN